jgi:hypothetical protein
VLDRRHRDPDRYEHGLWLDSGCLCPLFVSRFDSTLLDDSDCNGVMASFDLLSCVHCVIDE